MRGNGLLKKIKDYLFPYFCINCDEEGEWWCKNCRRDKISKINRAEGELSNLTALFKYRDNKYIEKLIKAFKYDLVSDIENLWRDIIKENMIIFPEGAVLIPVPLYKSRLRERGYNQAEIIGRVLSEHTGRELETRRLVRVRQTKQQAKLGFEERLKNTKDAFCLEEGAKLTKVVLVDDVYTTGATMNECARVLRKSGVTEISGFVIARG